MDPNLEMEAYFKARDLEKIKTLREKEHQEELSKEKEERKKLHYMHCPKCGATMETINVNDIEIDKCPECLGLYFDNNELEQFCRVEQDKRKTVIHKLFGLD